jgi:hypothetical protein
MLYVRGLLFGEQTYALGKICHVPTIGNISCLCVGQGSQCMKPTFCLPSIAIEGR